MSTGEPHPTWTRAYVEGRREFLQEYLSDAISAANNASPDAGDLQGARDYVAHEMARLDWIVASGYVRDDA